MSNVQKYKDDVAVTSFYSFVNIKNKDLLQPQILLLGKKKNVKGTVLLADEGFNGSLSGDENDVIEVLNKVISLTNATDVSIKTNYCPSQPFSRLKVKLKKEIVTLGVGHLDVNNMKGEYIAPDKWDEFIARPDVVLVDTRNDYEVKIGTFKGAVDPLTPTFRDFPAWVEDNRHLFEGKKIAMCCTGGIRCEKSTAYMKAIGYKEVYHLHGGILQYLEDTNNKNHVWNGTCFVFDDRVAVDSVLSPSYQE